MRPARIDLKKYLKVGQCYRRKDLAKWSASADRHLKQLVTEGTLQKFAHGLYYSPKITVFGKSPPGEHALIRSFLGDNSFLLTSPNDYNSLGIGTTQLYNRRIVYNHKRNGELKLGNRIFDFRVKRNFPRRLTVEFLLVDLINNVDQLAEDRDKILRNALLKVVRINPNRLRSLIDRYGTRKTKKLISTHCLNLI